MKLYPYLKDLFGYTPKDDIVTGGDEVKLIRETLHLDEATADDIFNYRTLVVSMWMDRYKEMKYADPRRAEKIWNAMMSITAVLDEEAVKSGGEV